jgi:hypothetical protein
VLRRIFGPKREEMEGERRRLHNEELHDLFATPNVIGVMDRSHSTHGMRNTYKISVIKAERRRLLGRPRRSLEIILEWILEK